MTNLSKKFFYRIDDWIIEGCVWIAETISSQYINSYRPLSENSSTYRPLSEGSYVKLPAQLRSPKK